MPLQTNLFSFLRGKIGQARCRPILPRGCCLNKIHGEKKINIRCGINSIFHHPINNGVVQRLKKTDEGRRGTAITSPTSTQNPKGLKNFEAVFVQPGNFQPGDLFHWWHDALVAKKIAHSNLGFPTGKAIGLTGTSGPFTKHSGNHPRNEWNPPAGKESG